MMRLDNGKKDEEKWHRRNIVKNNAVTRYEIIYVYMTTFTT